MKKKIYKICGVALALVLVFGLFGAFVPANTRTAEAQAYTPNQWNAMTIPSGLGWVVRTGSNVTDIAVGPDGSTIYAVDAAGVPDTIQLVTTSAFAGATPADDVTVTLSIIDQTGAVGASAAAVIPGGSAVGVVVAVALIGPATGVNDVDVTAPAPISVIVEASALSAGTFDVVGVTRGTVYATGTAVAGVAGPIWADGAEFQGVLKSTNGGQTFTALVSPTAAALFVGPAILVAVSPDNPSVVAIVDSNPAGNRVFYSNNGGATWSDMGVAAAAPEVIYDIAISIARAEAILGRDIVVCTANPLNDNDTNGDIYLVGTTTTWVAVGTAVGLGGFDYTSVAFEPNWVGGRAVVAVYSTDVGALIAIRGTHLVVVRTTTPITLVQDTQMSVTGAIGPALGPHEVGEAALGMVSSSLVLPADFDSTFPPAIQAYIGFTSATGADDVYRIDLNFTRKLGIAADVGIQSVAFNGTLAGGTLFAGQNAGTQVWHSEDPQTALPSWAFSYKPPTGAVAPLLGNTIVAVTADTVYAGTSGAESGFSKSTNGGVSYNQLSLIDTTIAGLDDVMPTPDNSAVFLSTNTGANSSLWKSSTPPSVASWERVRLRLTVGFIIRLSPEYLDDSTVYWCDAGAIDIQKSNDGANVFANRTAPAPIIDLVVESKDVVYMGDAANVRKSTNGAWFFGLPITTNAGVVSSLAMAPTYPDKPIEGSILVGGTTGGVSLSTDGGGNFMPLLASAATGAMQVLADKNYATNDLVYAGSNTAGQGIYRYEVGVSTAWESIRVVAGNVTGLAMHCGVLYGAWDTAGVPSGAERSLYPFLPDISSLTFEVMDVPAALMAAVIFNAAPSSLRVAGDETEVWVWAIDTVGTGTLMGYNDTMSKAVPNITVPAEVGFDPQTGGNAAFTMTWNKLSNAMLFNVEIYTDAGCSQFVAAAPATVPFAFYMPDPLAPSWNVPRNTVPSGGTYYMRVRVRDEVPGDAIRSGWSNVEKFTVEAGVPVTAPGVGPMLLGPIPGSLDAPLKPGFSWGPMAGTTEYEFILATDAALSSTVAGTPVKVTTPSWQCPEDLAYNTTYFWGVKATMPAASAQSIGTFTTIGKVVPPTPPVVIEPTPVAPPVVTPAIIWAIIVIGAILVIAVIVLILRTRRVA